MNVDERIALLVDGNVPPNDAERFLRRQFDLGLAWVHFDEGLGGANLESAVQTDVDTAIAEIGGPNAFHGSPIGVGIVAPSLHAYGRKDQKLRYLRPLFSGEEIWCQLFSEPGAGSDLANISTRAVLDGDEWVVNGQKVWTSQASIARWGFLLARTDSAAVKHAGLTCFVVDMRSHGIDVRPLVQMTGEAEFNEVYLTDVRIPAVDMVGSVGDGWRIAMTTLMNERVAIGGRVPERNDGPIGAALRAWQRDAGEHANMRQDLVRLWIRAEVQRLLNLRMRANRAATGPGPEGSIPKLIAARLNADITSFLMDLVGAAAMLKPDGYPRERATGSAFNYNDVQHDFLRAPANAIEGGTSEIAKNVLGERVLGLPPEPRVDKGVPWKDLAR